MALFPASWRRKQSSIRQTNRSILNLDRLESRETPAGNITALYHAPTRTLTLNASDVPGALDQQLVITGIGENAVSVRGLDGTGTTINRGGGSVEYTNVENIFIKLYRGNDYLIANNVQITGKLTVDCGGGDDLVEIGSDPDSDSRFGSLFVDGGDGDDELRMHNGNHIVDGDLRIAGGRGDTTIILGDQVDDTTTVGRLIAHSTGTFFKIEIGGRSFNAHGPVTLNAGWGKIDAQIAPSDGATIDGHLTITSGRGDDSLQIGAGGVGSFSLGGLVVQPGSGNLSVRMLGDAHDIAGAVLITGPEGGTLDFLVAGTTYHSFFLKLNVSPLRMSSSNIAFNSSASVSIPGGVVITGGNGDDIVAFGDGGLGDITLGPVTIASGPGSSGVVFGGANHLIQGDFRVSAGATTGDHLLSATGNTFVVEGKLIANWGRASNTIVALTSSDSVTIEGQVSITNGLGDDTAIFGTTTTDVLLNNGVVISNGPGQGFTQFVGSSFTINGKTQITNGSSTSQDVFNIAVNELTATGSISIHNGSGPSQSLVQASAGGTIGGLFSLTSGDGLDEVVLQGVEFNGVALNLGRGGSTVVVDVDTSNKRNLQIAAADGDNDLSVFGATDGDVTISTGAGADNVTVSATIGGKLSVSTGAGDDTVNLLFLLASGPTSIATGLGNDSVIIDAANFDGTVSIQTGSGDDSLLIATNESGTESTFTKAVAIGMGAGTDTLVIGIDDDTINRGIFQSSLVLDAGGGIDEVLRIGPPRLNSFAVQPLLLGGWDDIG